jgi:hypothetical protein
MKPKYCTECLLKTQTHEDTVFSTLTGEEITVWNSDCHDAEAMEGRREVLLNWFAKRRSSVWLPVFVDITSGLRRAA